MGYNVLIADDVAFNRKLIRDIITSGVKDVCFFDAQDGIQVMEIIKENAIDLIILDMVMPMKDGFQVLQEIKSIEEYKDIPIIVCSAVDSTDSIKKALALGAYDYFTKPLTMEQMEYVLPLKIKNALKSNEQRKLLMEANKRLEEEIERVKYLSFHDSLTGLYNRTYFDVEMERLQKDLSRWLPLTIISIDVDGLKIINDTFGHRAGDKLLKEVAKIIAKVFRKVDIIARMGGDEFSIVLPHVDFKTASQRRDKLYAFINQYNEHNPPIPMSISVGLATFNSSDKNLYDTYQRADDNMYECKLEQSCNTKSRIIDLLLASLEGKDYMAQGHGERLAKMAKIMADRLELTEDRRKNLALLARLHDLGKIGLPDSILNKRGVLSEEEFATVKEHTKIGYTIARRCREISHIAPLVLHHHEWYNGEGYPEGIAGDDIPLECRIFSILDAFDVMTKARTYRDTVSVDEAIEEIKTHSGTQFDPEIAKVFIHAVMEEKENLCS